MPPPSTRARVRRLALAALPLTLLGACSDNPEPAPLPSPATSSPTDAAPSASPSAAPTLPPEARENTPEGAEAFVRHWVEVLNFSTTSGETDVLKGLTSEDCSACQAVIDLVERTYEKGGHIDSDGWVLRDLSVTLAPDSRSASAAVIALIPEERTVTGPSAVPEVRAGGEQPLELGISWTRQHWKMKRLGVLS